MIAALIPIIALAGAEPPVVTVDRDNVTITESCRVRVIADPIADADGDGVIHITGDDLEVEFLDTRLHGAAADVMPDAFAGTGVRITGRNVTLRGARVSGYKVGIHAAGAHGLTIRDCDISGNFRQRLTSTPQREDATDWLWPHANDGNEWLINYGAGLYIEDADGVTVTRVRGRAGQNGIILDRVNDSRVYDNDCSFLSGWGLALWRSSRNVITRNAFDFCVRGYSHGVYNRGQDSAGILMFEQCHDNLIAENSATHSGDGFFGFAGREALGEDAPGNAAGRDEDWFRGRGHTGNVIANNDFSYAVAHGIELTFSFDNDLHGNRLVGNGICGVWGGYSQRLRIAGNTLEDNGEMAYGLERGGINIEHGRDHVIAHNTFRNNRCGIHLWWDNDETLLATPWAKANRPDSDGTLIHDNSFTGDAVALHLRDTTSTRLSGNTFERVGTRIDATESPVEEVAVVGLAYEPPRYEALGEMTPVGARAHLRGREHIVMEEWGPYDWVRPLLRFVKAEHVRGQTRLEYHVLGATVAPEVRITSTAPIETRTTPFANAATGDVEKIRIAIRPSEATGDAESGGGAVRLFNVEWRFPEQAWQTERRVITDATWKVRHFASPVDPREDADSWRLASADDAVVLETEAIDFPFGNGGPAGLGRRDHFGTIATTTLRFPAGRWRLRTISDDGIRVWLDDQLVIDDWTWHGPTEHPHDFTIDESRAVAIRVEHFELDGYAVLKLDLEPSP